LGLGWQFKLGCYWSLFVLHKLTDHASGIGMLMLRVKMESG
jgi:hypothetical protein